MSRWMLRQAAVNVEQLAQSWGINPVLAHVLAVRGFREKAQVKEFLQPSDQPLPSPLLLADMPRALEIVAAALKAEQNIVVFGDYDADGIMSTVILHKTLAALGARVSYYIPQRESEGYGLNNEALDTLKQNGAQLIIACDNGVSAFEQVQHAKGLGLDMVILDHHDIPQTESGQDMLVTADAVVDAKRQDCRYPFKLYCAAGLCYRFSQALYEHVGKNWQALGQELLPLAALATVCDLVDLVGENRALVQLGLPSIALSANPGLKALIQATGLEGQEITVYHLGFRLGPCVNASGRLEDAALAVELFSCQDEQRAQELAEHLCSLNEARKTLTEQGAASALRQIEQEGLDKNKVILLHCPQVNESVAGIIAGKIKEQYHKPVIVVAGDKEIVRGSARSIEAYHIYEALSRCQELFINYGGHPMAAGFSIAAENVPLLRERLLADCALTEEDMQPLKRIDKVLPLREATLALAHELQAFEPYGKGNPPVYFADKGVQLHKIALIGQNKQVMRLSLKSPGMPNLVEAVCFDGKEKLQELLGKDWELALAGRATDIYVDIMYTLNVNTYQGRQNAQIQLIEIRLTQNYMQ